MPLGDDEKAKSSLGSGSPANLASESGLCNLAMRSDKPEAKGFQDRVTKAVLPAIRKNGAGISGKPFAESLRPIAEAGCYHPCRKGPLSL